MMLKVLSNLDDSVMLSFCGSVLVQMSFLCSYPPRKPLFVHKIEGSTGTFKIALPSSSQNQIATNTEERKERISLNNFIKL